MGGPRSATSTSAVGDFHFPAQRAPDGPLAASTTVAGGGPINSSVHPALTPALTNGLRTAATSSRSLWWDAGVCERLESVGFAHQRPIASEREALLLVAGLTLVGCSSWRFSGRRGLGRRVTQGLLQEGDALVRRTAAGWLTRMQRGPRSDAPGAARPAGRERQSAGLAAGAGRAPTTGRRRPGTGPPTGSRPTSWPSCARRCRRCASWSPSSSASPRGRAGASGELRALSRRCRCVR
jgi:hypothetical protein